MDQELSKDCSAKIRPIVFSLETPHLHWPLESVWCWQWRRRKINIEQFDLAGRIRDEVILESTIRQRTDRDRQRDGYNKNEDSNDDKK